MMDLVLEAWVSSIIEAAKLGWMLGKGKPWQPGEKLKLLFAGYNGTRNTGSDVRVEEMLRQIRHILGAENVAFSVMTQNFELTEDISKTRGRCICRIFSRHFLSDEVPQHHGVVACEGSMFKSKFANALTTMMIGSLGIAAAQNKLSVGYGAEAGHMDPLDREDVRALLPGISGDHAQRGIAHCSARTGCSRPNWVRTLLGRLSRIPPNTDRKSCGRCGLGRQDAGAGGLSDQSV